MARNVRVEYEGAIYHVFCRGDRREAIFQDEKDRELFLETLGETCARTGFRIHGYVLMPNHYHFLLETPEPNLVAGMKWFQGTYTQRFNSRHHWVGHLFQGRYKAIPVDPEEGEYFGHVSDYIHLNPVRSHMLDRECPQLDSFPWSSYPSFIGSQGLPPWLFRGRVFSSFGLPDEGVRNRRKYASRMNLRVMEILEKQTVAELEKEWRLLRQGWYIGGEGFRDRLMDRIDGVVRGHRRSSYRSEGMGAHDEREADLLLAKGCNALGVALSDLWGRKQTDLVKQGIAWYVKSRSTVGDEWICRKLEMGSRTNVHRAVKRFRKKEDAPCLEIRKRLQLCAD